MPPTTARIPETAPSAGEVAILDAAVQLFSVYGYDGVSMRRIAEAAGVSKANIYHHFASKQALYFAIMRRSAEELTALLENLAEGKGSFNQRLQAFAGASGEDDCEYVVFHRCRSSVRSINLDSNVSPRGIYQYFCPHLDDACALLVQDRHAEQR